MKRLLTVFLAIVLAVSLGTVFVPVQRAMAADGVYNVPSPSYPTIEAGIDAAYADGGGIVQVAPGVYQEGIPLKNGVKVMGAGWGATILDGRVYVGWGGVVDSTAVLSGFTITNEESGIIIRNSSPVITDCFIVGNSGDEGAMHIRENSSPTVTNCTFSGNQGSTGGGMYIENSSPTVTNCTFYANHASYKGGGMCSILSSTTVTNCTFYGNKAGDDGGGMYIDGDTVTNCTFYANEARDGGGMYNWGGTVTNCTFYANQASSGGGGMDNNWGTVTNCTFYGNQASSSGGGMQSRGTVTNCTFSGNQASSSGGGMQSMGTVTNCILWDDSAPTGPEIGLSDEDVTYCDVQGGYADPGGTNINADPMFANPGNLDFHLSTGSPCIDAGNSAAVPEWLTSDFEGDDRIIGAAVDMGVDEFVPTAANEPPVAEDDDVTTDEDSGTLEIYVLANDYDPDGDILTIVGLERKEEKPGQPVIKNKGDHIEFEPLPNWNGVDIFTYDVIDGNGGQSSATVTVTVNPINDAPAADDQEVTTYEDTPVGITLTASDVDEGDTLTYTVIDSPTNGELSGTAPDLTYTPDADYNGDDSFTFKVNDGELDSNLATVSITVNPVNDAPVAQNDSATTDENMPVTIDVLANDSDPDEDDLTVSEVTQGANGSVEINADGTVTYTPNLNFNGTDSFVYMANDGNDNSNVATVTITVNPLIIQVTIDIKPGSDPNSINLKSKGVVPVAVLTTDDFDASDVDTETVTFAGAAPERWTAEDVDGDGDIDLLFHFRTQKLDLTEDSESATLAGQTLDGHEITGTDSVRIVPQKGKK